MEAVAQIPGFVVLRSWDGTVVRLVKVDGKLSVQAWEGSWVDTGADPIDLDGDGELAFEDLAFAAPEALLRAKLASDAQLDAAAVEGC